MAQNEDEAPTGAEGRADEAGAKGGRKKPLLIGAALMALSGAGAFAAVSMGLVPGLGGGDAEAAEAGSDDHAADDHGKGSHGAAAGDHGEGSHGAAGAGGVAFVPVEPITLTLGTGSERAHLRFTAQLEVPAGRVEAVQAMMPRVIDVMGGYLRALEPAMVEERDAHLRLRAQILRRVRLVLGADAVRDLLVMEFVIN